MTSYATPATLAERQLLHRCRSEHGLQALQMADVMRGAILALHGSERYNARGERYSVAAKQDARAGTALCMAHLCYYIITESETHREYH